MFLLLDRHRELFQRLVVEPALPQNPRKLARQRPLVPVAREKRNRLAALPTPSWQPHNEPSESHK